MLALQFRPRQAFVRVADRSLGTVCRRNGGASGKVTREHMNLVQGQEVSIKGEERC